MLNGCAVTDRGLLEADMATRLKALLPADVILLGEQHDNPHHQRVHREVVETLAAQRQLAAVVLEMAAQGRSTAPNFPVTASENEVKAALQWDDQAWAWDAYAPVVMAAVKAGVAVVGANLPRAQIRGAMADAALDARLDASALKSQNQLIREGHCDLLPESQIGPMTRVQIGRDVAMAQVLADQVQKAATPAAGQASLAGSSARAITPKIVLLIAGSGHVDAALGVPRHWPTGIRSKSVLLGSKALVAETTGRFDAAWPTPGIPPKDYCAELKKSMGR